MLVVLGAFALGLFVRVLWIQPEMSSAAIAGRARAADPAAPDGNCHHIGPTHAGNIAPSLSRVFERPIASDSFEHYSVALKGAKGVWSRGNLLELLTNPGTFSPGAAAHEVSSKEQALAVIEALRRLD